MSVQVKICGLCRAEDARLAIEAGADYLGVVMGAGPRQQNAAGAAAIWNGLRTNRVGVYVDPFDPTELVQVAERLELDVIQLHGSESPDLCEALRGAGPWAVWKALHLSAAGELETGMVRYADSVDGLLIEGRSPRGAGGVGARFDWADVALARRDWPQGLALVVAGGLTPENVGEAIAALEPDVVDVSSGVETEICRKDPSRMRAFIAAAGRSLGEM